MSVQIVPGSKNACYCLMHTWLEREGRFYCLSFFEENSAWGTIKVAYVVIRIMLQSRNDVGWQVVFLHKRYIHFSSYRMNKHQFSHTFEYSKKKQSTVYFFEGFSNTMFKIGSKWGGKLTAIALWCQSFLVREKDLLSIQFISTPQKLVCRHSISMRFS